MKALSEIFPDWNLEDNGGIKITDVTDDSRKVTVGGLFVAVQGNKEDGRTFIQDAIVKGASCVVFQAENEKRRLFSGDGVLFFQVPDVRAELACIAANFFDSSFENIVTVTGTNGKSSTVDIFRQILNNLNLSTGSIGTLGVIAPNYLQKSEKYLTCPGAIELHQILHSLSGKVRNIAIEASSHGIVQRRVANIDFRACGFTNFTEDHLDYHKTMAEYWRAKRLLFSELAPKSATFVINADVHEEQSEDAKSIAKDRGMKCITYGYNHTDMQIESVEISEISQLVRFEFLNKKYTFELPLVGKFQVYNALCALGMCWSCGVDMSDCVDVMQMIKPIPGRMELIVTNCGSRIFVDYAHTPDALQNAIISLKKSTIGRVFVVFGCGGERDQQKRKIMGQLAEKYADVVIVTDDNPRSEDPETIRKEICVGCPHGVEIPERAEAIRYAIHLLSAGDSLLIAGKGHETYQMVGERKLHFSDKEVVLSEFHAFDREIKRSNNVW